MTAEEWKSFQALVEEKLNDRSLILPLEEKAIEDTLWIEKEYYGDKSLLSSKAKEVQSLISSYELFGCQRGHVLSLLSLYLEEPLRDRDNNLSLEKRNPVLVPLDNRRGGNYPLNEPALMLYGDIGLRLDGTQGNHMDLTWRLVRPALLEEIHRFFQTVPIAGLLVALYQVAPIVMGF